MEPTIIRCDYTRQAVTIMLPPASRDSQSSHRAVICPECMKVHFVRKKEPASHAVN